jgi:hypothetical protein
MFAGLAAASQQSPGTRQSREADIYEGTAMKPDFIVAGFSKCGTTSLCAMLDEHPQLCLCDRKECNFFLWNFEHGWSWYDREFQRAKDHQLRGDGSVFYTAAKWEKTACARIARHCPDVRLIWVARDPIKRLESSYRENHHSGHLWGVNAPWSLGAFLREFTNTIDDTLYWERINTYRRCFPDSQFHVLFLEDLVRDPQAELARIFAFLGVDPTTLIPEDHRRLNSGANKLYDSPLMRFIRKHSMLNRLWNRMGVSHQDRLGRALGIRRPFMGPVEWDPVDLEWVLQQILPDATAFLDHYGKPRDFWSCGSTCRLAA